MDYVFNGQSYKIYLNTDRTSPQNIYGKIKLQTEEVLNEINFKVSLFIPVGLTSSLVIT